MLTNNVLYNLSMLEFQYLKFFFLFVVCVLLLTFSVFVYVQRLDKINIWRIFYVLYANLFSIILSSRNPPRHFIHNKLIFYTLA